MAQEFEIDSGGLSDGGSNFVFKGDDSSPQR